MQTKTVSRSGNASGKVIPFLLVVVVCLGIGLFLGSVAGNGIASHPTPAQDPEVIAFLGYRSFQPAGGGIRSIWVLTLDGRGRAKYLGISPATIILNPSQQPILLRDFLGDPLGAPGQLYQVPFIPSPAMVVEFDEQALTTIINRMGGIPVDGRVIRGQDFTRLLESSGSDPLADLQTQSQIILGLFGVSGPCLTDAAVAGLSPLHIVSNIPVGVLIADCIKRGPYLSGSVTVELFDHVLPLALPDGSTGLWPDS